VTISNSHSTLNGGIIYIDILDGDLLIEDSIFTNFSAPNTGLGSMLYSVASDTLFTIKDSIV
jgi:hypothetical protein